MDLKAETKDYATAYGIWNELCRNKGRMGDFKVRGMSLTKKIRPIKILGKYEPVDVTDLGVFIVEIKGLEYKPLSFFGKIKHKWKVLRG